jgi:hypothetical protein
MSSPGSCRSVPAGRQVRHGHRSRVVPPGGVVVPGRDWPAIAAAVGEEPLGAAGIGRHRYPQGRGANYRSLILIIGLCAEVPVARAWPKPRKFNARA